MANRRGHAGRVDLNQSEIVRDLRSCGISVSITATVGNGHPDLTCGLRGKTCLLEVKQPGEKLTVAETKWHESWNGQVDVVSDFKTAYEAVVRACGK